MCLCIRSRSVNFSYYTAPCNPLNILIRCYDVIMMNCKLYRGNSQAEITSFYCLYADNSLLQHYTILIRQN